jgi:hypothetical protein
MTTRGILGAAVGLLLVAGTLAVQRPLDARAIGGLNTVSVSPAHGRGGVPFQVTYAISPCQGAAGLTIGFSWGALPAAGQVLGTAATNSACRATLTTAPPANAATHLPPAPGTYQVLGYVALPTGAATPNTEASASYTVDVTSPTGTASASAKANGSAGVAGNPPASPSTTAVDDFPAATTDNVAKRAEGWLMILKWPLASPIGVLALIILAAIGFLFAWLIRRRRTRTAAALSKDKAA